MGIYRTKLISDTGEMDEGTEPNEYYTRKIIFPSLIASSPEGLIKVGNETTSWPPTFDQFLELPELLANQWYEAVVQVNGHWFEMPEIDPKKAKKSSKG
jgi:hypothetical protein